MGFRSPVWPDEALALVRPVVELMEEDEVVEVLAHPVSQSRAVMHRIWMIFIGTGFPMVDERQTQTAGSL